MSTLKTYITAKYGAELYKETIKLKIAKKNTAKTKNQLIFLQKCISHKIIPKSLRLHSPIKTTRCNNIVQRYRFELLTSIKNDAKRRYFSLVRLVKDIQYRLSLNLHEEDFQMIEGVTEKSREKMFCTSKERLVRKFRSLKNTAQENSVYRTNHVKNIVLNLSETDIPSHHKDLLALGPKFVPSSNKVPYLDIISMTESTSLRLEYNNRVEDAQNLRRSVLRLIKINKQPKRNLTLEQLNAMKEIKEDENISIYPFDKGTGFVRIEKEKAIEKIREQIGQTKIVETDPTAMFAVKIRSFLLKLKKRGRFSKREYENLYPSDPIPPRMYGTVKAHKPEKSYPMRVVVSTVGTPSYEISNYLVNLIKLALDKNPTRLKNSSSFVEKAKNWTISSSEIQVSYDVVNLYPSIPLKEATILTLE